MPRNHRKGGSLASYFYEAAGGDGLGPLPGPAKTIKGQAPALNPNVFLGPSAAGKRKRSRSTSRPPKAGGAHPAAAEDKPKSEGMVRHEHKVDLHNKVASMKKHFSETDTILERNSKWPMHYTHSRIIFYIGQCKDVIKAARSHKGAGSRKANSEAVHSKHLHETDGWSFGAIHSDIHQYSESVDIKNHLSLEKPLTAPGESGMYVNVVLAWLFAAKRQLMTTLAKYISDQHVKTADMVKFLEENEKGVNARRAYRTDKNFLGAKHHAHPYDLHDKEVLARQHSILYD